MIYSVLLEERKKAFAFFPFPDMKTPVHIFSTDVFHKELYQEFPHLIIWYRIERKSLEA